MYDRIVAPLDGSDVAEAALSFVELIPSRHARLLAVEPVVVAMGRRRGHVAPPLPWSSWRAMPVDAYLDLVAAPLRRQGRSVEVVVESGDPGEQIVAAAADADLIVMGTRGRGAAGRALFGSVADHVARHASAPTLLVRGTDPKVVPAVARVVVPLDGSAAAEAALPVAATLSGTLGVRTHLTQVVDAPTRLATACTLEREAAAYLEEQAARLRAWDVLATSLVLHGPVARTLLAAIGHADLVVMTPRGRSGVRRALLGSVAERLVREAPASVLLVRSD
jgi:nucleotide-binding universal stress UspA family protein